MASSIVVSSSPSLGASAAFTIAVAPVVLSRCIRTQSRARSASLLSKQSSTHPTSVGGSSGAGRSTNLKRQLSGSGATAVSENITAVVAHDKLAAVKVPQSGKGTKQPQPLGGGLSPLRDAAAATAAVNRRLLTHAAVVESRQSSAQNSMFKMPPRIRTPGSAPTTRGDDGDAAYGTAGTSFSMQPGASTWAAPEPFKLELGGALEELNIAYETWGSLNKEKNNAILLHTGMSAHTHAASNEVDARPGWWEKFIGPKKALDTDKYFVICTNVLGSCYGTTGPSSINRRTGRPYGSDFPAFTVNDMIHAQFQLLDSMGIKTLHASVGSSLGGMQSLAAAALYPDRVQRLITISAAARSHPSSIAIRFAQRQAIVADPDWCSGHFYGSGRFPVQGMKNARIIGTISYRSGPEWETRFLNKRKDDKLSLGAPHTENFGPDFLVETYLSHQAEQFSTRFDPNSLLYVSKAMDMFDMGRGYKSLKEGLSRIKCPALVLGVQSDILFPVKQQKEIADTLRAAGNKNVTYYELDAVFGHDTFLLDVKNVGRAVKGHIDYKA